MHLLLLYSIARDDCGRKTNSTFSLTALCGDPQLGFKFESQDDMMVFNPRRLEHFETLVRRYKGFLT